MYPCVPQQAYTTAAPSYATQYVAAAAPTMSYAAAAPSHTYAIAAAPQTMYTQAPVQVSLVLARDRGSLFVHVAMHGTTALPPPFNA
jgi:hypothetical protein